MILLTKRLLSTSRPIRLSRLQSSSGLLDVSSSMARSRRLFVTGSKDQSQAQLQTSVFTIPNILTMSRIACVPFIGHYVLTHNLTPAIALFGYSCLTDFLDGYIARKFKMQSVAGTILDPIADKLLMIVTTISLSFTPGPQVIPMSIALLILGRDISLGVSALFFRYSSMKQKYRQITWSSYWNFFRYPSAEVKPTQISKYNTFFQMIYLGFGVVILIINDTEEADDEHSQNKTKEHLENIFKWMGYVVAATTVVSGGSYVFSKDAVKFLKR